MSLSLRYWTQKLEHLIHLASKEPKSRNNMLLFNTVNEINEDTSFWHNVHRTSSQCYYSVRVSLMDLVPQNNVYCDNQKDQSVQSCEINLATVAGQAL